MKELEEKIKKLNEAADRTDDSKKTCQDLKKVTYFISNFFLNSIR